MSNTHPNASSPSEKLIGRSSKISNKIAIQILRFSKMSHKDLIAYFNGNRFSSFCSLQTPDMELFYGLEGRDLFLELAETLIKYAPELKDKVDVDKVVNAVKEAYSKQFIIDGKPLKKENVKDMLDLAALDLKSEFKVYTHYIPCVFFTYSSPDEFTLGPVKFIRTPALLASLAPVEWVAQKDNTTPEQQSLKYYKDYPWVACVEVESCDFDASFKIAVYACTTALNAIRVCFGSEATKMVRLSTQASDDIRTAKIWVSSDDGLECSHSFTFKSPHGPLNWYELLNKHDGGRIKSFFGQVIERACALLAYSELASRLIDSVNWFGDACLEKSPAAAIVKYVTSIERLYMASADFGIKERFVSRVSKILTDFELSSSGSARQSALKIYDLRSTVVHGGYSPRLGEILLPIAEAEKLAQGCILCSEQLYRVISDAFEPRSPSELEAAMKIYEAQGLQWCIEKAIQRH